MRAYNSNDSVEPLRRLDSLESLAERLGSPQDHMSNFHRIMQEMADYRATNSSARRNYERNIDKARQLVEKAPLVHIMVEHNDNPKGVKIKQLDAYGEMVDIPKKKDYTNEVNNDGLKPAKLLDHKGNLHMDTDHELGLDNYVFASFYNVMAGYEGRKLILNPALLDREGTIFSVEDIAITLRRASIKHANRAIFDDSYENEAIVTYKRNLMPGSKFKEFMAEFIATYYSNPEYYFDSEGRPDIEHFMKADAFWSSPEIKVYGTVEPRDMGDRYRVPRPAFEREKSIFDPLWKKLGQAAAVIAVTWAGMNLGKPQKEWQY